MIRGEGNGQMRRVTLRDDEWDPPRGPGGVAMVAWGVLIAVLLALLVLTALAARHHAHHVASPSSLAAAAPLPARGGL
jgi:hypothetical protein